MPSVGDTGAGRAECRAGAEQSCWLLQGPTEERALHTVPRSKLQLCPELGEWVWEQMAQAENVWAKGLWGQGGPGSSSEGQKGRALPALRQSWVWISLYLMGRISHHVKFTFFAGDVRDYT